jgi:hypothetical protein
MHLLSWVFFILFLPSVFAVVALTLRSLLGWVRKFVLHTIHSRKTSRQS